MMTRHDVWVSLKYGPPSYLTRFGFGAGILVMMMFSVLTVDRYLNVGPQVAMAAAPDEAEVFIDIDRLMIPAVKVVLILVFAIPATASFVWWMARDRKNIDMQRALDKANHEAQRALDEEKHQNQRNLDRVRYKKQLALAEKQMADLKLRTDAVLAAVGTMANSSAQTAEALTESSLLTTKALKEAAPLILPSAPEGRKLD